MSNSSDKSDSSDKYQPSATPQSVADLFFHKFCFIMIGCHYEQGVGVFIFRIVVSITRARTLYIIYTRMRAYRRVLPHWCIKILILIKNLLKYLVNSPKSSTFAPDFALNASERQTAAKRTENVNAENQPLTKKVLNLLKKVAKKFGQSKKKQYLCSRFRNERKWATKDCETAWKS